MIYVHIAGDAGISDVHMVVVGRQRKLIRALVSILGSRGAGLHVRTLGMCRRLGAPVCGVWITSVQQSAGTRQDHITRVESAHFKILRKTL
jgi:hypothetical protein